MHHSWHQYSISSIKPKELNIKSILEEASDDVIFILKNLLCKVKFISEEVLDDLCNIIFLKDILKLFKKKDNFATLSKGLENLLDKFFKIEKL